jgi:hypothetical protein
MCIVYLAFGYDYVIISAEVYRYEENKHNAYVLTESKIASYIWTLLDVRLFVFILTQESICFLI